MHELTIEKNYLDNRNKLVKRMSFKTGSVQAGEDVVQEAYLRAWQYRGSFTGIDFDRWFSTILKNCLYEHKNNEKGYSPVDYTEEDEKLYGCQAEVWHQMRDIRSLIATKSKDHQEVLLLWLDNQYTPKQISEITNFTYAMCHQILLRFKKELSNGRDKRQ